MATGTVKWFSDEKGYGSIRPDEAGKDLFVHHSAITGSGFKSLAEGAKVSYDTVSARRADRALRKVGASRSKSTRSTAGLSHKPKVVGAITSIAT